MPKTIKSLTLLFCFALLMPLKGNALNENSDTVYQRLYQNFLDNYNAVGKEKEFYQSIEDICAYFREHDMKQQYYKMLLNLCLYDTENNKPMKALKQANEMLKEMEAENFDAYSQVYLALGTIYESRGNYRMAYHFYEEAIRNLASDDAGSRMGIYSRIAYLKMFRDPIDAKYWNDKYEQESNSFPDYHQVYLFLNSMISFSVGDKFSFYKNYTAYKSYHEEHPELDNYGLETLETARLAFDGDYEEALEKLRRPASTDLNAINRFDMLVIIYSMMNRYDQALQMSKQRIEYVDSLNSDMLFTDLNELNVQTGLLNTQTKAAQSRKNMLIIMLILATVIIVMLGIIIIYSRKNREELSQKNNQLHAALAMAEEGERMKTEFVRSVSHEIRTPLNAINGFNDVLNTPGIELSAAERADFLQRIRDNVKAITNIVDEMLRVADKASNEFYPKSSKVYCNQFFSNILYKYRDEVSSNIELNYTSTLINRFQIETNEEGVRKILEHLIQNAIKFTSKGSITLHCEQSEDNNKILLSISDTGRGISKEQQDKIFDEFYKADMFDQGIGLGLTVSKKIARKLGGDLIFDDSYTKGARFVLSLPV